jgi:Ca-activated chloride channel family protein
MTRAVPQISDEELFHLPNDDASGFGALDTPRGRLPLKILDVSGRLDGLLSQLSVRQTFVNSLDEPLEATYIFPLPDRAAVRGFRMLIGQRTIEGVLEERSKAREHYDQALASGQRAAIAEEERSNVFTLRVGNIMPGEMATVHLDLAGVLPFAHGEVTFRFPLVVAPRYIPGLPLPGSSVGDGTAVDTEAVPDAYRISPPVLLKGFASPVRLSLAVDVHDSGGCIRPSDIRCSLHAILAQEQDGCLRIRVEPGERLDRDFVLRYRLGSSDPAKAIGSTLTVHPDRDADGQKGTFALTLLPPAALETLGRPRDVVFVLDRSGSMQGWKIVAARRALSRMIDTLVDADRFAVLAFDNSVETPPGQASEFVPATDRNRFRTLEYLARVEARGGTEMAEPLAQAATRLGGTRAKPPQNPAGNEPRERILVLLTDGQVGNEDQILRMLSPRLRGVRVFALGIDRAVNEGFLRRLSEVGNGHFEVVESEDRLDEVMTAIHRQIGTPLLTGLSLEAEGLAIEPESLVPKRLPDLFPDAPLVVLGRYQGRPAGLLMVKARDAAGRAWSDVIETRLRDNPAIAAAWARGQVRKLEDRYAVGVGDVAELERQIIAVSLRFCVLSRFTAYVAIDRSEPPNESGQLHRITQPVEMPEGWEGQIDASLGVACFAPPASMARERLARIPRAISSLGDECKLMLNESADIGDALLSPMTAPGLASMERGAAPAQPIADLPDRYQIQFTIGRGGYGMSVVAFDRDRGTNVILRVIYSAAEELEKILLAARSLLGFSHKSLATVLDAYRCQNAIVLVTEAVEQAAPLDQVLKDRLPGPVQAAKWVAEIAEALHQAHDHGCDWPEITSSEVSILSDATAVITDPTPFALASAPPDRIRADPMYLAPERRNRAGAVDRGRISVYALGALLFMAVTGFPRMPRSRRQAIPRELETICEKAMAEKPEDRYMTPGELAQALSSFLGRQPKGRQGFWKRS